MGAAATSEGCIVLNLQKMKGIIGISKEDMSMRLQAGVLLEDAAEALAETGLLLGHDPWSRPIATVGGAISTNGVGYTAAKYGPMGEQVLGLEAVLPEGEVVHTKGVPKSSAGPSLNHLFIGSEGTFGVITEATLRAFPRPEKRILRAMLFPDFESGFHAVAEFYAQGVRPAMVDYGEELWARGSSSAGEATLYLAFEGFRQDVEAHVMKATEICRRFDAHDGDAEEVHRFWETRHASGERYRKEMLESHSPDSAGRRRAGYRMDYLHVALPVSRVLEYRRRCQSILDRHRVVVREWSLWARPEFFSFLIFEEEDRGEETSLAMGEAVDEVLTLAQEMDGAMEYCHGVGIKLAHLMEKEMGTGMDVLRTMKRALDPHNIMNPGKLGNL